MVRRRAQRAAVQGGRLISKHDPIPAITESEATGEIAALFTELRVTLGVPFVNLIWRHLATIPGGLAWTWSLLRPLYASSDLSVAAQELCDGIELPCLPLDSFVYDSVGVDAEARTAIAGLIVDYNRANALNFLALSVACLVLRGEHQTHAIASSVPTPIPPSSCAADPATLRLLGINELPPSLHALVLDFDSFGRISSSTAVASLYRHLGYWPGFLALAHTALLPLQRDGSLQNQQEQLIARSRMLVETRLGPLLQTVLPLPGSAECNRILSALDEFTRLMIGRMTVMGTALLALLPCGATSPHER